MPAANPETLRPVAVRQNDKSVRESRVFYHDGEHVYYQHHLLPLKDTESLYGFTSVIYFRKPIYLIRKPVRQP